MDPDGEGWVTSAEERRDLLARAEAVFGRGKQAELAAKIVEKNGRAIAFLALDPRDAVARARALGMDLDADAAANAMVALSEARVPPQAEIDALELCIRIMRPAWLFRDSRIVVEGTMPCSPEHRAAIEAAACFVVAVTLDASNETEKPIGSGFLVARDRVVTNKHVRDEILKRWSRSASDAVGPGLAQVRFGLEDGSRDRWSVGIIDVAQVHPTEDVLVLRLAPAARLADWPLPRLAGGSAVVELGTEIAAIGHPMPDARNPTFSDAVFGTGGAVGMRRASPGRVIRTGGAQFSHDCSTLGGSSGSPVIDLRTGIVIGVHACGMFAVRNVAIATTALFAEPALRDCVGSERFD